MRSSSCVSFVSLSCICLKGYFYPGEEYSWEGGWVYAWLFGFVMSEMLLNVLKYSSGLMMSRASS